MKGSQPYRPIAPGQTLVLDNASWAWLPWGMSALGGTLLLTAARRFFYLMTPLDRAATLQKIKFNLSAAGAGGFVRAGIYGNRIAENKPGGLPLLDGGEHAVVGTGEITLTGATGYTFQANTLYWMCFVASAANSALQVTFSGWPMGANHAAASRFNAYTRDTAYGALENETATTMAGPSTAAAPAAWAFRN